MKKIDNEYFDKMNELNLLRHKQTMNSMKIMKICLGGGNPENLSIDDLKKENEELKEKEAVLSVDVGLYKSLEEFYQEMEV